MPATIPTERVDFSCRGIRCAAWLTLPSGPGPHPAVVLVHGLGATHDMMLTQYEQHFAAAGIATLAFDYRNTGASDGQPRQHISMREQRRDVVAALEHLRSRPEVDGGRIGLWGTSLGGMNVVRVAAARDDLAVAVVQCPIVHGPGAARRLGVFAALRLTPAIAEDLLARDVAPRPTVRADRRRARRVRDGHCRRRRMRLAIHGSAGRAVRQPDRRRRRCRDGDDVGHAARPPRRCAVARVRMRPREPDGPRVRRAGRPPRAPRRRARTTTPTTSRSTTRRWWPGCWPTKPPFFRSISVSARNRAAGQRCTLSFAGRRVQRRGVVTAKSVRRLVQSRRAGAPRRRLQRRSRRGGGGNAAPRWILRSRERWRWPDRWPRSANARRTARRLQDG